MPVLPDRPVAYGMQVIEVLGMTGRVVDLSIGVVLPLGGRVVTQHLADNVTVAGGEFAPAIADHRGCRYHRLDFGTTRRAGVFDRSPAPHDTP